MNHPHLVHWREGRLNMTRERRRVKRERLRLATETFKYLFKIQRFKKMKFLFKYLKEGWIGRDSGWRRKTLFKIKKMIIPWYCILKYDNTMILLLLLQNILENSSWGKTVRLDKFLDSLTITIAAELMNIFESMFSYCDEKLPCSFSAIKRNWMKSWWEHYRLFRFKL